MTRYWPSAASRLVSGCNRLAASALAVEGWLHERLAPQIDIPRVDGSRQSWEALFLAFQCAVLREMSPDRAYIYAGRHVRSDNGKSCDGLEGFARSFLGLSFFVAAREDAPKEVASWLELYLEGLCNGSDPGSSAFWGQIKSPQLLVESAALAVGLMAAPSYFWERLSQRSRLHLLSLFRANLQQPFPENNWLWFRVMQNLALEKLGEQNRGASILEDLATLGHMYRGDGWYHDGFPKPGFRQIDYYNAYAMHFYGLLFALLQEGRYAAGAQDLKERAARFFDDYEKFFPAGGHPPAFGRSMIYRFASIAPWGPGILAGSCPVPLQRVKNLCVDTVNSYLDHGCVERSGRLGVGVYKEQPNVREGYSGGGSPYWAYKAFSLLLIPANHSFWQDVGQLRSAEIPSVATVAGGDAYIVRNENQALLINACVTHPWYALNYNRFAYSNCFPATLDQRFPADNMLLLRRRGKRYWGWRLNNTNEEKKAGGSSFRWVVNNDQSIGVDTSIMPLANGYMVRHAYRGDGDLEYALGGFAVGTEEIAEMWAENGLLLIRGPKQWSALVILDGCDSRGRFHRGGKGVGARKVTIPCFNGILPGSTQGTIGAAVLIGTHQQDSETVIRAARLAWAEFVKGTEVISPSVKTRRAKLCGDKSAGHQSVVVH